MSSSAVDDDDDAEFTIRVTGAAPAPFPTSSSSSSSIGKKKKRGKGDHTAAIPPPQTTTRRLELRLRPSSSLESLKRDVLVLFFGVDDANDDRQCRYGATLLAGFPPKELGGSRGDDDDDAKTMSTTTTMRDLGIRPNESLIVRFVQLSSSSSSSSSSNDARKGGDADVDDGGKKCDDGPKPTEDNDDDDDDDDEGRGRRRKRASAVAASANFKEVIAAQDAAMMSTSSRPRQKKNARGGAVGSTTGGNGNVVGFGSNDVAGGRTGTGGKRRPREVKMDGAGYRLYDGKSFVGSSPPSRASSKDGKGTGAAAAFGSEDDVANKLLSSLGGGGGGGGGNVGRYLRMAMRGAVAKTYEARRAAVRVAAVDAGEYALRRVKGGSVVDGGGVVLGTADDHDPPSEGGKEDDGDIGGGVDGINDDASNVLGRALYAASYSKGMDGRGKYEERVEIIGLAVLRSVLESVYNAEPSGDADAMDDRNNGGGGGGENTDGRLRPVLIAQLSPRAFWSLVYHCSDRPTDDRRPATARPSVDDMLRSTMPQLDWSHLDRGGRMRAPSEKAKENMKQRGAVGGVAAGASTRSGADGASRDDGAAEARVKAVEDLAESALIAAMADEKDGAGSTERERRAKAAMARYVNVNVADARLPKFDTPHEDDWNLITPVEDDIDELIECIMEGADEKSYDGTTAKSWAGILLDNDVRNWREMANSEPERILSLLSSDESSGRSPSPPRRHPPPPRDAVEGWIDASRSRAMIEIMLEILDGDQDALESLQDNARSCTPRDLSFWKSAPGMLLDAMSSSPPPVAAGASSSSSSSAERKRWERADATRWIRRAGIALGVCTWLGDYTTRSVP